MNAKLLFIFLFLLTLLVHKADAQIPQYISYQGVYTDTLGNPKPDGVYTFTFRIYETATGGTPIWTEIKDLQVMNGLFSTLLGDTNPFGSDIKFDKPYWLGVKPGSEPELIPRTVMSSVGYSFSSMKADTSIYALEAGTIPDASVDSNKISDNSINSSKVIDGSLRLADLAVWTLAGNIGGATVPANGCVYFNFGTPEGGLNSDLILVKCDVTVPSSTALNSYFSSTVIGGVCNFTTSPIVLPNPFVLRIYGLR